MNNISLHVKGLGKIEEATIELAPLTLFVGDNNSGKSYLMTVLYGLLNDNNLFSLIYGGFGPYIKNESVERSLALFKSILESVVSEEKTYKISAQDHKDFNIAFNLLLKNNKDRFIEDVFNYKFALDEISVDIPYVPNKIKIKVEKVLNPFFTKSDEDKFEKSLSMGLGFEMERNSRMMLLTSNEFSEQVLARLTIEFFSMCCDQSEINQVLFFPTSRTGFMLGYKSMISKSIDSTFGIISSFNIKNTNLRLSKPSVDFLQKINGLTGGKERLEQENEFIPNIIDGLLKGIDGNIEVVDQSSEIVFSPNGTDKKLPLYITSGVVTELAPLILFLSNYSCSRIMMEEPEMGLHPKLQKEIARVLVRLSNNGIPVIVTTHSDTIIQHINNMIKLSNIKSNEALLTESGYESDDVVFSDKVRIYQFDTDNKLHKTTVTNLKCSEYGFETPTFYNTLLDMYQESKKLEDKIK